MMLQGSYGEGCNNICTCQNGGSCDHITGECRCPPGVKGHNCEDGCPPGYYGIKCDRPCTKPCPNGYCDRMFGHCDCLPGYFGPTCSFPCPEFSSGVNCQHQCDCDKRQATNCNPVVSKELIWILDLVILFICTYFHSIWPPSFKLIFLKREVGMCFKSSIK